MKEILFGLYQFRRQFNAGCTAGAGVGWLHMREAAGYAVAAGPAGESGADGGQAAKSGSGAGNGAVGLVARNRNAGSGSGGHGGSYRLERALGVTVVRGPAKVVADAEAVRRVAASGDVVGGADANAGGGPGPGGGG